jgi:hypothetical protein
LISFSFLNLLVQPIKPRARLMTGFQIPTATTTTIL